MKKNNLIPWTILIAALVLFFFPSPEENFLAYALTAIAFAAIIIFLNRRGKKK